MVCMKLLSGGFSASQRTHSCSIYFNTLCRFRDFLSVLEPRGEFLCKLELETHILYILLVVKRVRILRFAHISCPHRAILMQRYTVPGENHFQRDVYHSPAR